MEYIIETNNLCKSYGKKVVLNNLNLHVPKGSIYGLIGRNGAGKTTFMRIISGIAMPTKGEFVNNSNNKMSTIIETAGIYEDMSVIDNLKAQCMLRKLDDYSCIDEILQIINLKGEEKTKASKLSLGMKQRLGIGMALIGDTELIVLDEPMNGLDPNGIIDIRNIILNLNKNKGITFIISSHILDELSKVATHLGFIDNGELIKEISSSEIIAQCPITTNIDVSDAKKLVIILEKMGINYSVETSTLIKAFGKVSFDALEPYMTEENIKINSLSINEASLESYYLNIMSGNKRE